MALALLFEDDSVMFLDAVTNYAKSRSSNISNHPIDSASVITDHVSKNNPVFTVRGVVSSADFNTEFTRPQELLTGENTIDTEFNQPVNPAEIQNRSNLLDFLPGSIQQFLSSTNPSQVSVDDFRGYSHQVARDRLERAWDNSERITLLDYDYDIATGRSSSVRSFTDCIIERYEDNEDVQTGDALAFNLTFRKIRIAFIKETDVQISQAPAASSADEASSEANLGDQTGAETEGTLKAIEEFSGGVSGLLDAAGLDPSLSSLFN